MCRFSKILITTTTVVLLTLSLALAGAKFDNVDTAKDRRDNSFGTDPGEDTSTTSFGKMIPVTRQSKPRLDPNRKKWTGTTRSSSR